MTTSENPYRIEKGRSVHLSKLPTRDDALFEGDKKDGLKRLDQLAKQIAELQNKLFARNKQRVLIVLQGMDGAGKSSTIRDVFRYTNTLGVHAHSFGKPSEEELERDYLWRIHQKVPRLGEITVFDRSHYEDITTVKVLNLVDSKRINQRIRHILAFEKMLVEENTVILKFFIHLSKEEQAGQLLERLEDKTKHYKFNPADLEARAQWQAYEQVWSKAIEKTSTDYAPWFVIPADRRWYRKLAVAQTVCDALTAVDANWPDHDWSDEEMASWTEALAQGDSQ